MKKIDHYMGCEKTPDWVYDVEDEIDDAQQDRAIDLGH